jgi:hypothetical protein
MERKRPSYKSNIIIIEILQEKENIEVFCVICLLNHKKQQCSSTNCNHLFVYECLNQWLAKNPLCPLCRTECKNPIIYYC